MFFPSSGKLSSLSLSLELPKRIPRPPIEAAQREKPVRRSSYILRALSGLFCLLSLSPTGGNWEQRSSIYGGRGQQKMEGESYSMAKVKARAETDTRRRTGNKGMGLEMSEKEWLVGAQENAQSGNYHESSKKSPKLSLFCLHNFGLFPLHSHITQRHRFPAQTSLSLSFWHRHATSHSPAAAR